MISSSGYPCVIQEFDCLLPVDSSHPFTAKEYALTNLNALHLRRAPLARYVEGFILSPPEGAQGPLPLTVGTWEHPDKCRPVDRPWHLDPNSNEPEGLCRSVGGAPPDSGSPSPPSTPSLSSLTSSSSTSSSPSPSPLSSCPESDASPDTGVGRSVRSSSRGTGGRQGPPAADRAPGPERGRELPSKGPLALRLDLNRNLGADGGFPPPPAARPGKDAPLRSPLSLPLSSGEGLQATVTRGHHPTLVTLSPFEGDTRPFPMPRVHGQHLMTFDSPTGIEPSPAELRREDEAHSAELRREDEPCPEELRQEDKDYTEELCQEVKTQPREFLQGPQGRTAGPKDHPAVLQLGVRAQLHPGTNGQATELRPGTKTQVAELRPSTKSQAAELCSGTKAQVVELRPSTKSQATELRPGTKGQATELRSGTEAQAADLRPGTKSQAADLRPGAKAQASDLRPGTKSQAADLRPGAKSQAADHRPGTKSQAADLRTGAKSQAADLRLGTKSKAADLRLGTKSKAADLRPGTKSQAADLRPGTKSQVAELRPGTKSQAADLCPGTKSQAADLRLGTKSQAADLCPATKSQAADLCPGTKSQAADLRLETKSQATDLRPGTKSQASELRPGTKAQASELRAGTKGQAADLRPGTKGQAAELHPRTKGQAAELRPGTKAQSDTRSPRNITSFHELAQKRRQSTVGQSTVKVKEDRSDWLITFSPESEMPMATVGPCPEPGSRHKEVTTFRELRYRTHLGRWNLPPAPSEARPSSPRPQTMRSSREPGPGPRETTLRPDPGQRPGEQETGGRTENTGSRADPRSWSEQALGVSDTQHDGGGAGETGSESSQFLRQQQPQKVLAGAGRGKEQAVTGGGTNQGRGKADGQDKNRKEGKGARGAETKLLQ
ncbi:uncharacterized protein LOC122546870 [Chiloscyllium plagiosum]|uniref:uncharacterized protein LOC122546870 n=1 Tax=Chiloscyllium plagiosum TaxID=36176 RepID=UPI001CB819B7|nr:uncharacterized protein LOC122546870 [Chiloscyllium plagiosum]